MKYQQLGWYIALTACAVVLLYGVGFLSPENFWGLHYPSYLEAPGVAILVLVVLFTILGANYNFTESLEKDASKWNAYLWALGLATISGVFFYKMPIYHDVYGDSLTLLGNRNIAVTEMSDHYTKRLFSMDFTDLKLGTGTTLGLVGYMSYYLDVTIYKAISYLGAYCGFGFVLMMHLTTFRLTKKRIHRVIASALILGTPALLMFCGHIEVYAPVYLLTSIFAYFMVRYVQDSGVLNAVLLFAVAFLSIKFHVTGFIVLLIAFLTVYQKYRVQKGKAVGFKQLFLHAILPVYILGILLYVFVTKSVNGPRSYTEENLTDAIFLPISAAEGPPLSRYNLFSFNHLFDFFNLTFLWSAGALVIILVSFVFFKDKVNWKSIPVQIFSASLCLFVPTFFVLNPLLSMPTDWDLMSIPAAFLILFAISLLGSVDFPKVSGRSVGSFILMPIVGLAILGSTAIFVNADAELESERVLDYGKYTFKTYWIGSSTPIFNGLDLIDSEEERMEELERIVKELKPFAVKGNDVEYSALLNRLGNYNQTFMQDPNAALENYELAYQYDPLLRKNVFDIVYLHFLRRDFVAATKYLPTLVAMKYPNHHKSLRIAIHTSLEAEDYEGAKRYSEELIAHFPDDKLIQDVLNVLSSDQDKSQLKFKFSQNKK